MRDKAKAIWEDPLTSLVQLQACDDVTPPR